MTDEPESDELELIAEVVGVRGSVAKHVGKFIAKIRDDNFDDYFRMLGKSGKTWTEFGRTEESRRLFASVLDKVGTTERREKLEAWKNVTLSIISGSVDVNRGELYIQILDQLTVWDLLLLSKIYETDYSIRRFTTYDDIKAAILQELTDKGISMPVLESSMRRLASQNLFDPNLTKYSHFLPKKNEFGAGFLKFISDEATGKPPMLLPPTD